VEDLAADRVVLQVTGDRQVGVAVEVEPDHRVEPGVSVQHVVELQRVDADRGRLDLEAVHDAGDAPLLAEAAGGPLALVGARCGAELDLLGQRRAPGVRRPRRGSVTVVRRRDVTRGIRGRLRGGARRQPGTRDGPRWDAGREVTGYPAPRVTGNRPDRLTLAWRRTRAHARSEPPTGGATAGVGGFEGAQRPRRETHPPGFRRSRPGRSRRRTGPRRPHATPRR
jgi:hypothetical protein